MANVTYVNQTHNVLFFALSSVFDI